jgi:hypothetical protein
MGLKQFTPALLFGTGLVLTQISNSAQAAVFDLTSASSINAASIVVLDSGLTLTVDNSNSTGLNPNTINTNTPGLCAFAATGTSGVGRCGYGDANGVGISSFQMSFDKPVSFNSFDISDYDAGNGTTNMSEGKISFSLDNINFTDFTFSSTGTKSLPSLFQNLTANQTIYVKTEATFATSQNTGNFRINNINATEVPGPLPILGVSAAFSMSRKFRRLSAKTNA